jgi:hypothetical protein
MLYASLQFKAHHEYICAFVHRMRTMILERIHTETEMELELVMLLAASEAG